ncbi:MAG: hypothetical protein ACI4WH_05445 [Oscillospiraceae bacterium]
MNVNKYLLTVIIISIICLAVGCKNTTVPTQIGDTDGIDTIGTSEKVDETTINTTITTTYTIPVSTIEPTQYKSTVKNIIDGYEVMLTNLNAITNQFTISDTWTNSLTECYNTSKYYLDTMVSMNSAVPIKYQKSHEKLIYCMEHYTASISLIQQAVNCYLADETQNGDYYMIQAINRSDLANTTWEKIRGYGVVEYTGETLVPPVTTVTEPYIEDEGVEYTLNYETTAQTTVYTYDDFNDGYSFDGDNVFIYD